MAGSSAGLASFAVRNPVSSLSLSAPVVVALRSKPRKPGNDQLNETSSALMHSPLWLVACLLALPTGYTTRGITLKLHSCVPMCALPPLRCAVLYTYSRITTGCASDATIRHDRENYVLAQLSLAPYRSRTRQRGRGDSVSLNQRYT